MSSSTALRFTSALYRNKLVGYSIHVAHPTRLSVRRRPNNSQTTSSQQMTTRSYPTFSTSLNTNNDYDNIVCIGDVHGNYDNLTSVWQELESHLTSQTLNDKSLVVFLGDYCDRGKKTKQVLDWLCALRDRRPSGRTRFLAGNHDFGFASFLGCLPTDTDLRRFNLDDTTPTEYSTGFWNLNYANGSSGHNGACGMHYQGRRWAGSSVYDAASTFSSYGVEYRPGVDTFDEIIRQKLIDRVPDRHKEFLKSLEWIMDEHVKLPLQTSLKSENLVGENLDAMSDNESNVETKGRLHRVIAVHAGLSTAIPAEEQIAALKKRDIASCCIQQVTFGRIEPLYARDNVLPMHPDFVCNGKETDVQLNVENNEQTEPLVYLVSGHHGFRMLGVGGCKERVIVDNSGGDSAVPIEAFMLPQYKIVRGKIATKHP